MLGKYVSAAVTLLGYYPLYTNPFIAKTHQSQLRLCAGNFVQYSKLYSTFVYFNTWCRF